MEEVFDLEPRTSIKKTSFIDSYPHIRGYFSGLKTISAGDLVRGAHMVYGWMPTILDLYPDATSLPRGAELLTDARSRTLDVEEITELKSLINNSVVGPSKLLHFNSPNRYAIWDSRICSFVRRFRGGGCVVSNVEHYLGYIERLQSLRKHRRFKAFHASVNKKVGYPVSALRALELVMYLNGGK